jgi:hypothetical protein
MGTVIEWPKSEGLSERVAQLEKLLLDLRAKQGQTLAGTAGLGETYLATARAQALGQRPDRAPEEAQAELHALQVRLDGLGQAIKELEAQLQGLRKQAQEACKQEVARERRARFEFLKGAAGDLVPEIFKSHNDLVDQIAVFDELRCELDEKVQDMGGPAISESLRNRITINPSGPGIPFQTLLEAGWRPRSLAPGGPTRLEIHGMVRPSS